MKEEHDGFDDFLHEMMQEAGPEKAPANFTSAVMGQITATQSAPVKLRWRPVITWKGWVAAAVTVVVACVVAFFLPGSQAAPSKGQVVAEQAVDTAISTLSSFQYPMLLVISLGAVFLLFALDKLLSKRMN
jgi:hypothetical protein